ncbi:hypothetical protein [Arthrospiribacter ruber]|uniref:Uncharacterized protein n=1 Tax=Arthrospiribacter ruber TaxID=2487934 RepID=A0A951IYD5_9BACT|nr:hypothetical protein [Arthrospiribacter ruber]MBW3467783.1 hypothetical protein [Arthrospiribacter ruber]
MPNYVFQADLQCGGGVFGRGECITCAYSTLSLTYQIPNAMMCLETTKVPERLPIGREENTIIKPNKLVGLAQQINRPSPQDGTPDLNIFPT